MLKKLILINFQIHKKLEVELHKRFNIIIGSNDHGKSSIIRAIHWVFYNEPHGDWMNRINEKGEKEITSVKLVFDDNTVITRKKGIGINSYEIDGEPYKDFGYGVPEQVLEKLKIVPFKTNKQEFNLHIAMQDEQPFLIHESGPVKASVLDVLTGNSLLQKTIISFNKESIQISKDRKTVVSAIEDDKEALKSIPDLENIDSLVKEIEKLEVKQEELKSEVKFLHQDKYNLALHSKVLDELECNVDLNPIYVNHERVKILTKELEKLQTLQQTLEACKNTITTIPDTSKVVTRVDRYIKLKADIGQLKQLDLEWNKQRKIIKNAKLEIEELENKVKQYYKQNPSCPECGRKW